MSENPFGENVIFSYTSEQATFDGVLVHPFPEKLPWMLLSASVHAAIEKAIEGTERTYEQAAFPLIMDAILIASAKPDGSPWTKGLEGNVTNGKVWIGLNDKGGLTLMRPEDY